MTRFPSMITSSGFPLTLVTGRNCHFPLCGRYFLRGAFRLVLLAIVYEPKRNRARAERADSGPQTVLCFRAKW